MSKNTFKELEKELEQQFTQEKDQNIKLRVKGSLDSLAFIADIVELYLGKFFSILIGKGNSKKH